MAKKHQIIVSSAKGRTASCKKWRRQYKEGLRSIGKGISIHELNRKRKRQIKSISKGKAKKEQLESYTTEGE